MEQIQPITYGQTVAGFSYRYLIGFMLGNIERALEDPMYPRFKRALQPMNRGTIDNADAVYFMENSTHLLITSRLSPL